MIFRRGTDPFARRKKIFPPRNRSICAAEKNISAAESIHLRGGKKFPRRAN